METYKVVLYTWDNGIVETFNDIVSIEGVEWDSDAVEPQWIVFVDSEGSEYIRRTSQIERMNFIVENEVF